MHPYRAAPAGLRLRTVVFRGLAPTASYGVAPSGLGYVVFPLPWVCTHGYIPSPLRGSVTWCFRYRGFAPTAIFRRHYVARLRCVSVTVGLHPRLYSVATPWLRYARANNDSPLRGAPCRGVAATVGLHPRLYSVATPWLRYARANDDSPLRGYDTLGRMMIRPYGGYNTPGRMMIRPFGARIRGVSVTVGLHPRLYSVATPWLGVCIFS